MKLKAAVFFTFMATALWAQTTPTQVYIERWYNVAIAEMEQYGIPASITLAQGILESKSGQSFLATKANNHFGIKCHLDWEGKKVYYDDDEESECFRKYKSAEQSYRDHSLFLKNRSRYAALFEEKPDDYKAWAKGLKKAGYATNRKYAKLLIELIERYDLHEFDKASFSAKNLEAVLEPEEEKKKKAEPYSRIKTSDNLVEYVIAKEGDSYESLAIETGKRTYELIEYNELRYDARLQPGDIVYIQPKRRKAAYGLKTHKVQLGETMYSISQRYGIKLEELYTRNGKYAGEEAKVGEELKLR